MHQKLYILLAAVILLVAGGVAWLTIGKVPPAGTKDKVAVTIFPLFDMVRNVAGSELETVLILPPGASPHTFDPTPQEVKKITGSRALFVIGHGIDDWSRTLADSAGVTKENIIAADRNIVLMDGEDPHYWLSVTNAKLMTAQIKDDLSQLFPEKAPLFETNLRQYQDRLTALESEINSQLAVPGNKQIATFHNAWAYFGRDHGVKIATTFEEFPGEEPTAEYLAEFTTKVRTAGVKVIFGEPQFSTKPLEALASDLGITISVLDPLGGTDELPSFEAMMKFNAQKIREVLL